MNRNLRIRTNVNQDKEVRIQLDQDFDLIEILSLNITQEEVYRRFCSDYGVLVGRVLTNTSFGVPNAKVSIFIPITDEDKLDPEIYRIYPYEIVTDRNIEGVRYNLLTPDCVGECHTPIGTFPNKRQILDNEILNKVYNKYYKFTTVTNDSGDYLFFGLPLGQQIIHLDVDISDIGILSQKPYNFIDRGANISLFENSRKFKFDKDLDSLSQVRTVNSAINIIPFWGDLETYEVGITRFDIDLRLDIEPTAFFIGSIFKDDIKNSVNKKCSPQRKTGNLNQMVTGEGDIEMIRLLPNGEIEEFNINGGRLIDSDGTFAYQIPMNLDRITTDEFGNIVASSDPNIGLPTRASVRFRIGFDEIVNFEENRKTAKFLVPNNPNTYLDSDYSFDESTNSSSFTNMYWNKIYTIKQFIPRYQNNSLNNTRQFIGIKDIENENNQNNLFPYNKIDLDFSPFIFLINFLLVLSAIVIFIVAFINITIINIINGIITAINFLIPGGGSDLDYIPCIGIECDGIKYAPSCINKGADEFLENNPDGVLDDNGTMLLNCICNSLTNIFGGDESYEFYNDWINGSLYFPSFKYKKRKKNKEKFCEYDCELYDPDSVNSCGNRYLLDTCTGDGISTKSKIKINDGLIYKDDDNDQLYYASYTHTSDYKMFATDIVCLGSINKCDWQNVYKFIDRIPSTTYKSVPDLNEFENGVIETSGKEGLFFQTLICGAKPISNTQNCTNLARICEIGVGTDDNRSDEVTDILGVGGGLVDLKITNKDIEDLVVRDLLVLYNSSPSGIVLNSSNVNEHALFNNSSFDGTVPYNIYRDYITGYTILPRDNSFYFYFGINKGNTAIDKFKRKYLSDCQSCKVNKIIILGDVGKTSATNLNDGHINITVIGGVPPYSYEWNGFNSFTSTNEDINNLFSGEYTIKVTDYNGLTAKKTFFVPNPLPLECNGIAFDCTFFGGNNGNILINGVGGGVPPYDLLVVNEDTNQIITQITLPVGVSSLYVNGTNPTDGTLSSNNYSYLITDQSNNSCGGNLFIDQPPQLSLNLIKNDISCNGLSNGSVTLNVNGGVEPYSYYISGNGLTYMSQVVNNLSGGTYSGFVSDSNGVIIPLTFVINEPDNIGYINYSQNVSCYGDNDGLIFCSLTGGTSPYQFQWVNDSGGSSSGLTTTSYQIYISNIGNVNSGSTNPSLINKLSGKYTFEVIDNNGCQFTFDHTIEEPNEMVLTLVNVVNTTGFLPNGSITVSVNGGNPEIGNGDYDFYLKQGSTIIDQISTSSQTVTFSTLNSGTYRIEVSDINNCSSNSLVIVVV